MARRCAFCNGEGLTREHVWPHWAAQHVADRGKVKHLRQVVQDGRDDEEQTWLLKSFEVQVKAVCGRCNNGWMSQLEGRVKPFFLAAFQGRGRQLHAGLQRDLAAWALKTAMMVEHSQSPARYVIPPAEYAYLYEHGQPSENVRIWMNCYSGVQSSAVGHLYGLDADMDSDPDPDRGTRDVWGATVVFGPVVFHLLGTDIPQLLASAEARTPHTHQLWPHRQSFTWTPHPGLDDDGLARFMDAFMNELLRRGGQPPHQSRRIDL